MIIRFGERAASNANKVMPPSKELEFRAMLVLGGWVLGAGSDQAVSAI